MSSFPKHSFEQAYDHAFPPSPPNGNNNNISATGSTEPSRASSPAQAYSDNYNSLAVAGPGLPTISERSPLITKAPIQNHPGSYTSINNNDDDQDDYHPNNNHNSHGTSVLSTDTLLEQGNSSSSGQYMSIRELTAREFKILLRYSGPVVLTYVLQNSLQLASLISLGHLGSIGKFACLSAWGFHSCVYFLLPFFRSQSGSIERDKHKRLRSYVVPFILVLFLTERQQDSSIFTAAPCTQTFKLSSLAMHIMQAIHPLFLIWLLFLFANQKADNQTLPIHF